MMLGGAGNNIGMLFGVVLWLQIRTIILTERHVLVGYIPFDPIWLEYILGGLMLMLIPVIRPYGLVPERPRPILPSKRVRRILEAMKSRGD
jgi:branched-chain amino acid transport system permease protein